MTRDEAREAFRKSGLNFTILTKSNIARLRKLVDTEMRKSQLINDTFRAPRAATLRTDKEGRVTAEIKCNSRYFKNRQAISFDADGFIGFAGWADDENVKPVIAGFLKWTQEMTPKPANSGFSKWIEKISERDAEQMALKTAEGISG